MVHIIHYSIISVLLARNHSTSFLFIEIKQFLCRHIWLWVQAFIFRLFFNQVRDMMTLLFLYGSVLWDLNHHAIESVCTTWRRGLRHVFGLPYNAHSYLLPSLSCSLPVLDELAKRTVVFTQKCLSSDSALVNFVASHSVGYSNMFSTLGRNVHFCCSRYNVVNDDFTRLNPHYIRCYFFSRVDVRVLRTVFMLLHLICVRSGLFVLDSNFLYTDVQGLIDWLAIN